MKFFKPKIYKAILEDVVTMTSVISFAFTMLVPQVAGASTNQQLSVDWFVMPIEQSQITQIQDFPLSGERKSGRVIFVTVTAYSSDVFQTDSTPCITANGFDLCKSYQKHEGYNTIAANFLSFDSQVKIPELFGDRVLVVRDRMNQRYGYGRIDVWFPTYEEAKNFGVKRVKMEVY